VLSPSVVDSIAKALGRSVKEGRIVKTLTSRGLSPEEAYRLIARVQAERMDQIRVLSRSYYNRQLNTGLALALGGVLLSVVTISISPVGIVFWGAVLVGIIRIVRGIVGLRAS